MTRDEHLLTIGAEECCEIAQRFTKTLRFGQEQIQAEAGHAVAGTEEESMTNRLRILKEFADLVAVMQMLGFQIPSGSLQPWVDAKRTKVEHFLTYSAQIGTLAPDGPEEAR